MRNREKGHTLVELMTSLTICAVLATMALTCYAHAIENSRKSEAYQVMSAILESQRRFYNDFGGYANSFSVLDFDPLETESGNDSHFTYELMTGPTVVVAVVAMNAVNMFTTNAVARVDAEAAMVPGGANWYIRATRTSRDCLAHKVGYQLFMDKDGNISDVAPV